MTIATQNGMTTEDMIHVATRASECDWRWSAEDMGEMPLVKLVATFADGTTRTRNVRRDASAEEIRRSAISARTSWLRERIMDLGR